MTTSQLVTDTKKCDGMIVDVITDLRKKQKRADCESIHKEIVKLADFSNIRRPYEENQYSPNRWENFK